MKEVIGILLILSAIVIMVASLSGYANGLSIKEIVITIIMIEIILFLIILGSYFLIG